MASKKVSAGSGKRKRIIHAEGVLGVQPWASRHAEASQHPKRGERREALKHNATTA